MSPTPKPFSPAPPRFIVQLVTRLRNSLLRLADRLVPAPIATIDRLAAGFVTFHSIQACARLGLADLIGDAPKRSGELASATGTQEDRLFRLLRMLSSVGVFEMLPDGRFRNNRLSNTLRIGAPDSLRSLALFGGSAAHVNAWDRFFDSLKTGENAFRAAHQEGLFEYLGKHPDEGATFNEAMVALTRLDAPALAAAYDFGDKRVCDVAGGHGTLLAGILLRHTQARGVLFDEAHVLAGAPAFLAGYGLAERCELVEGNFFAKVPEGCDVYILKDILHDWNDDKALDILKTVRASMAVGARLLIAEMVMGREHERFPGSMFDLEMMTVTYDGKQRSEAQFHELLERTGLRLERIIPAASPTSLVEAVAV